MFTHSKGAFCHLRVQRVKKPTEEDGWVEALTGVEMTSVVREGSWEVESFRRKLPFLTLRL